MTSQDKNICIIVLIVTRLITPGQERQVCIYCVESRAAVVVVLPLVFRETWAGAYRQWLIIQVLETQTQTSRDDHAVRWNYDHESCFRFQMSWHAMSWRSADGSCRSRRRTHSCKSINKLLICLCILKLMRHLAHLSALLPAYIWASNYQVISLCSGMIYCKHWSRQKMDNCKMPLVKLLSAAAAWRLATQGLIRMRCSTRYVFLM